MKLITSLIALVTAMPGLQWILLGSAVFLAVAGVATISLRRYR